MTKIDIRLLELFLCTLLSVHLSCTDLFIEPDPKDSSSKNFEILWNEFDRYYSHFELKNINWDSLYTIYRPTVHPNTSDQQLFNTFASMLDHLKDGHINIFTPFGNYSFTQWYEGYEIIFLPDVILSRYLQNRFQKVGGANIILGKISNEIGYIRIISFNSKNLQEKHFKEIDLVIKNVKDCLGLIVDVRDNGGGNAKFADIIASRFADKKRLMAYIRYRNGPEHSDFTDYIPQYIKPGGNIQFTRNIVVLTNRKSFSAAEYFVLAMKVLPYVRVFGDRTGGGLGNPISRELPNGWTYQIPRSILFAPDFINYEEVGIEPDKLIINPITDEMINTDTQLSQAIIYLNQLIY